MSGEQWTAVWDACAWKGGGASKLGGSQQVGPGSCGQEVTTERYCSLMFLAQSSEVVYGAGFACKHTKNNQHQKITQNLVELFLVKKNGSLGEYKEDDANHQKTEKKKTLLLCWLFSFSVTDANVTDFYYWRECHTFRITFSEEQTHNQ